MHLVTYYLGLRNWVSHFSRQRQNSVDIFSKSVHFVPLQKSPSASKMGDLVVRHIFRLHAIPMDIAFDTGPKFFFPVWKAFCSALSTSPQSQTVWLSAKNIPLDSRKLVCHYIGPFVIINSSTVRLKLPQSPRVYPSFHVSQLKPVPTRPLVRLLTPPHHHGLPADYWVLDWMLKPR